MWQQLTPFRIALLLGLVLSALRFGGCPPLELLDARAVDYRLLQRGVRPGTPEVVVVAIDDDSLEQLGRWPWSRPLMARLVQHLSAAGAAVIGFDIVQSESTAPLDVEGLRARLGGVDERTWESVRRALTAGAADDQMLADAVRASGVAVLGYFFDFGEQAQETQGVRVSTYNVVHDSARGAGERRVPQAPMARANLPELSAAAREVGCINFLPDVDGAYRRIPLAIRFGDRIALPLSLAMLRVYRPNDTLAIRFADHGVDSVRVGAVSVPVAEDGEMLINFRGPEKTFRYISAADLLADRVAPDALRGKLVLVGVTAVAVADVRVTPFWIMPGVEIHANVLDNILRNDFIMQPKWVVLVEIAVLPAWWQIPTVFSIPWVTTPR